MPQAARVRSIPSGSATRLRIASSASGTVEWHFTAEEVIWVEVTQDQIGIGHRRFAAAKAVAGRSGVGAGAIWSDLEQAELVDARNAAAASADLDHLDDRHLHRQTAASLEAVDARHLELRGDHRLPLIDDADFGGRAAHVEGDQRESSPLS